MSQPCRKGDRAAFPHARKIICYNCIFFFDFKIFRLRI